MQYQESFHSVRMHKQTASTTGKWETVDYLYAALAVGTLILIGFGGSVAASLGLV